MKFTKINIMYDFAVAITDDNKLVAWGNNGSNKVSGTPTDSGYTDVSTGFQMALALNNGSIVGWGDMLKLSDIPNNNDFIQVVGNDDSACGLRSNGSIVIWGDGIQDSNWVSPISTINYKYIQHSSFGYYIGIKTDNTLVQWGDKSHVNYTRVSNVLSSMNEYTLKYITMGSNHIVGIKDDGFIKTWCLRGSDDNLVHNTPTSGEFIKVCTGSSSFYDSEIVCGLKSDGSIIQWSEDNDNIESVPTYNDFVDVGVGLHANIFFGVRQNGDIVAWDYSNVYPKELLHDMPGYISINSPPVIQLDESIEIHNPSHTLIRSNDPDGDMYKISWRLSRSVDDLTILEGGNDMSYTHPMIRIDLSPGVTLPVEDSSHSEFILSVIAEDEHGDISTAESIITVVNNNPELNIIGDYRSMLISITDIDLDTITVGIYSNLGTDNEKEMYSNVIRYYNESEIEEVERESGPIEFKYGSDGVIEDILYNYRPGDIVVGEDNIISVIVSDTIWGYTRKDITITGEHLGLMFYSEDGTLYSSSMGDILNYMDFGNIRSDGELDNFTVLMRNTTSSEITDIQIYQEYQSKSNIIIEFSIDGIEWVEVLSDVDLESDGELDILIRARLVGNNRVPDGITTINISGNISN